MVLNYKATTDSSEHLWTTEGWKKSQKVSQHDAFS